MHSGLLLANGALVQYAELVRGLPGGSAGVITYRMTSAYLTDWLYVWLFIVAGAALVVVILLFSKLINPSHLTPEKLQPYECGIPPVGNPWQPFAVRYFVFGLLFLVFDVEVGVPVPVGDRLPRRSAPPGSSRCCCSSPCSASGSCTPGAREPWSGHE